MKDRVAREQPHSLDAEIRGDVIEAATMGQPVNHSPQANSAQIDALRALAALSVLVLHSWLVSKGSALPALRSGDTIFDRIFLNLDGGVDLFFVISGYLVGGPFVRSIVLDRPLPRLRAYALRRVLRIYPTFWVAFLILVTVPPIVHWQNSKWAVHWLLFQGWFPSQTGQGFTIAWSLTCEVAFYGLVPLCAALLLRVPAAARHQTLLIGLYVTIAAGMGTIVLVTRLAPALEGSGWLYFSPANLYLFAPGLLVAYGRATQGNGGRLHGWWSKIYTSNVLVAGTFSLLLVATIALAASSHRSLVELHRFPRAIAAALLLETALTPRRWPAVMVRALAPLGVISYSLYLWHYVIGRDLQYFGLFDGVSAGWAGSVLDAVVLFGVTLPVAVLSYFIVERPCLRLGAHAALSAFRRGRQVPTAAAPPRR